MTRDRRTSDPRAADLLARFAVAFDVPQHPVPVDSVACDLLGLMITETDDIEVSGLLVPQTMRVYVNAREASEYEGRDASPSRTRSVTGCASATRAESPRPIPSSAATQT